MVMPVATPMAKLMPNSTPQNFTMSRQIVRPGRDIDALHDRQQDRQPERQRHEQEVVHGRQAELQARERRRRPWAITDWGLGDGAALNPAICAAGSMGVRCEGAKKST